MLLVDRLFVEEVNDVIVEEHSVYSKFSLAVILAEVKSSLAELIPQATYHLSLRLDLERLQSICADCQEHSSA